MNSDVDFEIGKNVNTGMIKNSDKDIQQSIVIECYRYDTSQPTSRAENIVSRRCLIRWFSIGCTAIQSMLNPQHIQVSPQLPAARSFRSFQPPLPRSAKSPAGGFTIIILDKVSG
jgi:hypothetical protein